MYRHNDKYTPVKEELKMVDLVKLANSRPVSLLPAAANKKVDAREKVKKAQDTAGPAWYNLPKPEMTPDLEKDIRVIQMRSALDPKRHYKNGPVLTSKYFHVGTVVAGAEEFYSANRLTRKERGATVLDTLLKDDQKRAYFKKKFTEAQKNSRAGSRGAYKQKQAAIRKPWKK